MPMCFVYLVGCTARFVPCITANALNVQIVIIFLRLMFMLLLLLLVLLSLLLLASFFYVATDACTVVDRVMWMLMSI